MASVSTVNEQKEELDALSAIYGDAIIPQLNDSLDIDGQTNNRITATLHSEVDTDLELIVHLSLPPDYPSSAPPSFELNSPYLTAKQKRLLSERLQDIYLKNLGEPVLYQWVEASREFLNNLPCDDDETIAIATQTIESEFEFVNTVIMDVNDEVDVPQIFTGKTLTDRKSTFQSHLAVVTCKSQVPAVLAVLKSCNKIARATHNIYAYRIYEPEDATSNKIPIKHQDCEDDGETGAGQKLLHLLDILDARNVLVVVTRWYGGIHLGPDRFRHINNLARQLLVEHGFGNGGPSSPTQTKSSNKAKSKKGKHGKH